METLKTDLTFITRIKKYAFFSIKLTLAMGLNAGLLMKAHALGGIGLTALVGGSSGEFANQGQIIFPPETFRTDFFKASENHINVAPAFGVFYDAILEPSKYNPGTVIHDIALGVNAYFTTNSRSGSVYEYSLPDFDNSTYRMKAKNNRLMLDTEWGLHPLCFGIMPFIEAGVGIAEVTMSFSNIPRPDIDAAGGNYYLSQQSTNVAYEVGAGIKIPMDEHFIASARYLYANSGHAESGIFDGATGVQLASTIRTSIKSQSVLFGLSYFFG